jgi:peptide/nickel transport system permease protein
MFNIVTRGDFGYSFQVARPVHTLILERLGWTILMSLLGLMVGLTASFTLGIYSARHQYSLFDYVTNIVAFLGMATPGFFLALIFMTVMVFVFNEQVGGLFSSNYVAAAWSLGKVIDLLKHLSIPLGVGLVTGAGAGMRIIRGNLLDKLNQPYVQTARAKGLPENLVVYRHALRNALHPWVMGMSNTLSDLISGDTILSIVLVLPTVGLMFYDALTHQDSYVAGTFLLMATLMLQVGTLLADIVLAWLDPTVRFE